MTKTRAHVLNTKLAWIYDAIYPQWNRKFRSEFNQLDPLLKARKGKDVLEYGCGEGILLSLFERAGYNVTGVDNSKEFLALASKKTKAKLIKGDIRDLKIKKKFDCVIIGSLVLCYMIENDDVSKLLANAYDHLNDNGILYVSAMPLSQMNHRIFYSSDSAQSWKIKGGINVTRFNECSPEVSECIRYKWKQTYLIEKGGHLERWIDTIFLRIFTPSELRLFLAAAGFKLMKFYGNTMGKISDWEKCDQKDAYLTLIATKA